MVYLRKESYPRGTYHKLKSMKTVLCKIVKKVGSNAYLVNLRDDLNISFIFNVADLYDYHGFDKEEEHKELLDQV